MFEVYKTTNKINDRFYIGVHSVESKPNYLGSGKALIKAIKFYGRDSFKKEVLFIFNTEEEAYNKEAEIVDEDFIKDRGNYNIVLGGGNPPTFYRENHPLAKVSSKDVEYICSYYLQGANSTELGGVFGLSRSAICRILKLNGVKSRKPNNGLKGRNHHQYKDKPVSYIIREYNSGVSAYKIGKNLKLDPCTIITLLRKHNVAIRNRKKQTV